MRKALPPGKRLDPASIAALLLVQFAGTALLRAVAGGGFGLESLLLGGVYGLLGGPVVVVVNDRRDLYPEILSRAGLRLVDRLERHVNRRTGRRSGEYFESVLVSVSET